MRLPIVAMLALVCTACDIRLDLRDEPPTASPTGPGAISISNTATNSTTVDRSDTGATSTPSPGGGDTGTTTPLPLPAYGEHVTRDVAAANPALLANSCQETSGESAWRFLDLVISTLRAQDPRWGYLCKDAQCKNFARDVVAYRASTGDTGIWLVDIIGNHCPGPGDPPAAIRWGVLPFETIRRWAAARL